MIKVWAYIRQLVGNNTPATIGIFLFIVLLCFMLHQKAHSTEVAVQGGSSFGTEGYGPVLGLDYNAPIQSGLNWFAGTDLWGSTTYHAKMVDNNWDWHAGIEGCKWRFCASIGPTFVQRVDAINGAHTNFYLGLKLKLSDRFDIVIGHVSDAGTSSPNVGRQMLSIRYRLR